MRYVIRLVLVACLVGALVILIGELVSTDPGMFRPRDWIRPLI